MRVACGRRRDGFLQLSLLSCQLLCMAVPDEFWQLFEEYNLRLERLCYRYSAVVSNKIICASWRRTSGKNYILEATMLSSEFDIA